MTGFKWADCMWEKFLRFGRTPPRNLHLKSVGILSKILEFSSSLCHPRDNLFHLLPKKARYTTVTRFWKLVKPVVICTVKANLRDLSWCRCKRHGKKYPLAESITELRHQTGTCTIHLYRKMCSSITQLSVSPLN